MKAKKGIWIAAGVVMAISAGAFFYFSHSASAAIGNLDIYNGSAEVARGNATAADANGTGIDLGDTITVASGSRVSIVLNDGSEVRLEAGTKVAVSDIAYNGTKLSAAVFDLTSGRAWSHVAPLASGGKFEVETPTVVATVRGTNFDVSYGDGVSEVDVSTHAVWVALRLAPENTIQVNAGDFIVINDASAASDFAAGPQPGFIHDDWSAFNETQDAAAESDAAAPQSPSSSPGTPSPSPNASATATVTTPPSKPPKNDIPPKATPASSTPPSAGPVLKSLALSVQNLSINQNDVDPITVTATYSDGTTADVTKQVSWKESPALNIIDTQGNFHASFTGTTSIIATLAGINSNIAAITVNQAAQQAPAPAPITLVGIAVSCQKMASQGITYVGLPTAQCAASGNYSDGSTKDVTAQTAWTATGTAGGTVSAAGYYSPKSEGAETISASLNGIGGSTQISIP